MTIPIEIVAVFAAGVLAAIGFTYRKLSHIDVRMARIEEHLGIGLFHAEKQNND